MSAWSSISSIFGSKKSPVRAGMAFWDPNLGIEISGTLQAFQYFPEKIQDSRGVEYAQKTVPGGSHPIYTFISGGERAISFEAVFTNENASMTSLKDNPYSVDIPHALRWCRQATYPIISNGISKPPPLVVLYLPNSGLSLMSSTAATSDGAVLSSGGLTGSQIVGIMTSSNITYEAFHRDGTPRIAVVQIDIKEVVQTSKDWGFISGKQDLISDKPYVQGGYKRGIT
jgi:hypothetical protein